jgi:hypothetical protein
MHGNDGAAIAHGGKVGRNDVQDLQAKRNDVEMRARRRGMTERAI